VMRNDPRQPTSETIQPTATAPIARPAYAPPLSQDAARPRSAAGAHSRITRPPTGYPAASPTPSNIRAPNRDPRPLISPVNAPPIDQTNSEPAPIRREPHRSTAMPIGTRKIR
jgi:hypothetical protein